MNYYIFEKLPSDRGSYSILLSLVDLKLYKSSRPLENIGVVLNTILIGNIMKLNGRTLHPPEVQVISDRIENVINYFEEKILKLVNKSIFINQKTHQLDLLSRARGQCALNPKIRDKIIAQRNTCEFSTLDQVKTRISYDLRRALAIQLLDELREKCEFYLVSFLSTSSVGTRVR